jgi:voltage-gated potassium channel
VLSRGVKRAHPDGVSRGDGGLPGGTPKVGRMKLESRFFSFVSRKPLTPTRAGRAIALATLLVTIFCAVVMRLVDSKDFDNIGVAFWWAVQTVTTVGYGDEVPTDVAGRAVAALLMLTGIGFLTVVTASITAALIETVRRRTGDPQQARLEAKLDEVIERLQKLEAGVGPDRR